jgi:hypothetical protein
MVVAQVLQAWCYSAVPLVTPFAGGTFAGHAGNGCPASFSSPSGSALAVVPLGFFLHQPEHIMDLPIQQTMTPEQAFARLQEWFLEKARLSEAKSHEHLERVALTRYYFVSPREGTNRLDIGGGFDLKLDHKIEIKVDEAELDNVKAADIKRLKLPWDDLFVYKPTLVKSVYNELTSEQKKFVDQLVTRKEGSPQLEIVPSANRAGQQAHVEAAEAATAEQYVICPEAEKAQPGNFYHDGATWWCLNDEIEWDEVTDAAMISHLDALAADYEAATAAPAKKTTRRRKASAK